MHLNTAPLAIALAIILSTSSHVIAAPHRRHHAFIERSTDDLSNNKNEQVDQRYAHGPMHPATPPPQLFPTTTSSSSVTVATVKTVTVFPSPVKAPSATFALPLGMPIPDGTRRPVTLVPPPSSTTITAAVTSSSSSTTSTKSSTSSKETTSTTKKSSSVKATNAASSSSVVAFSSSVFVATLPSSTLSITISIPTSISIPSSIAIPSITLPSSVAALSSSAIAEALSALSGTTRKCCSAVHDVSSTKNNDNNGIDLVDFVGDLIPGFDWDFLQQLDTTIGLNCVDINEDDVDSSTGDDEVCWDVVSCCENQEVNISGSVFLGCVPLV
ncbi:hypothetical protein UA08_00391 [Talaromyces atroroseus]|uniref:Hydrophobin n=1 Tax=Talaromyces atroroseus TaxID=1441469 RepID=A0A225B838_TALAT|nr:hypothetical protein UA08_00391 [Talaromyces atroroseus]OKL64259.1 hypothetical protein UA08_00391 [Talaromyces atroroseus]